MPGPPIDALEADLRRWREQFAGTTAIAHLRPRHPATVVGVVRKLRVVPGSSVEATISDGTGRLVASWRGRSTLPGLDLGTAVRLTGTVAGASGHLRILNPAWTPVAEPYG